jgi:hypothetical protein
MIEANGARVHSVQNGRATTWLFAGETRPLALRPHGGPPRFGVHGPSGTALTRCSVLLKHDLVGIVPSLCVSVRLLTVKVGFHCAHASRSMDLQQCLNVDHPLSGARHVRFGMRGQGQLQRDEGFLYNQQRTEGSGAGQCLGRQIRTALPPFPVFVPPRKCSSRLTVLSCSTEP